MYIRTNKGVGFVDMSETNTLERTGAKPVANDVQKSAQGQKDPKTDPKSAALKNSPVKPSIREDAPKGPIPKDTKVPDHLPETLATPNTKLAVTKPEEDSEFINFIKSDLVQRGSEYLALFSGVLGNAFNIAANIIPGLSAYKDVAHKVATWGTKLGNSAIRIAPGLFQLLKNKNPLVAFGLLGELGSVMVPLKKIYPFNGIFYGLMLCGIAVNRGIGKMKYDSFQESLESIPKGLMNTIKDFQSPIVNFFNSDSGMLSLIDGIAIGLGGMASVFGDSEWGLFFRGFFSNVHSFDRLKSLAKQPMHFMAGVCHLLSGTVGMVRSMLPKSMENITKALESVNMLLAICGKVGMKRTLNSGEVLNKVTAKDNTFINFYNNYIAKTIGLEPITDARLATSTHRPDRAGGQISKTSFRATEDRLFDRNQPTTMADIRRWNAMQNRTRRPALAAPQNIEAKAA